MSAILAARTDPVAPPAVVTWAPVDPSGTSTDHAMRLDGDPGHVLAAVAALVGLRDAASAPDLLRELEHPDDLLDTFTAVADLPATDSASPDAVVQARARRRRVRPRRGASCRVGVGALDG